MAEPHNSSPRTTSDPTVIMIVRHGEKPDGSDTMFGVTPSGEHDQHSLSVRGWTRAGALVGLFAPPHGQPPPGLAQPAAIYASGHASDGSHRPVQTVTPLAQRLSQTILSDHGAGEEPDLARDLTRGTGAILVAWQHEAIPKIAEHLGNVEPSPPRDWADDRFDLVWTFTRTEDGWTFAQVPQQLLAGDLPDPIS